MHPAAVTVLEDRLLLGNGISVVEPDKVCDLFIRGVDPSKIQVVEHSADTLKFNERSDIELKEFNVESELTFTPNWLIPSFYLDLDLTEYFANLVIRQDLTELQIIRIEEELAQVQKYGFENGLRTIIYVVDSFKKRNQLWGIGRGSSCASYLLFLIGLHQIDPLRYDIHWSEFFHD